MTRTVLLLNSDKPEVLTRLARRADLDLRVMTRPTYADLYQGIRVALVDSFEDHGQVERASYELSRGGSIDRVLAATEKSVIAAGLVRDLLGVPGATFEQSLWGAHKRAMKDRLSACGVPVAAHLQAADIDDVTRAAEQLEWPVIVKPVLGSGSKHTHVLRSAEELRARSLDGSLDALAGRGLPIQVERLVELTAEYHCDGVVRGGEVRLAAVNRYFAPPLESPPTENGGHFVDPDSEASRQVLALHESAVAAIGVRDAVTHLEAFESPHGFLVGEIAIRPGGLGIARSWAHAHGVDLWEEFVRAGLDEPTDATLLPQTTLVGRTQLPALPDVEVPGVFEVLSPEQSGLASFEAHFRAADVAGLELINQILVSRAKSLL